MERKNSNGDGEIMSEDKIEIERKNDEMSEEMEKIEERMVEIKEEREGKD